MKRPVISLRGVPEEETQEKVGEETPKMIRTENRRDFTSDMKMAG